MDFTFFTYFYVFGVKGLSLCTGIAWVSWVIYNLYLSPYKHIPGPLICQIIPFYDYYFIAQGIFHEYMLDLHLIYGPIVRIGGNRIIANHPDAWNEIHSTYKYDKTLFYKHMRTVGWGMISLSDRDEHSKRRRIVRNTFSKTNIGKLENIVKVVGVDVLTKKLKALCNDSSKNYCINMSEEFASLTYDIIGKLVFSMDFGILNDKSHYVKDWNKKIPTWLLLDAGIPFFHIIGNIYLRKVANMAKDSILLRLEQVANKEEIPEDILSNLMSAKDPETEEGLSELDLIEECTELLIAGSDSTAHTLTWILYTILKHPCSKNRIVEEIDLAFPKGTQANHRNYNKDLPYLEAVIKEVMRLYPIGAHPLLRLVPEGGANLLGYTIPGKTEIVTNCYSMHHSPEWWYKPKEYLPERWLEEGVGKYDLHKEFSNVYVPFITGPRNCIGRYLGMLEIQLTLISLFQQFDMHLADENLVLEPVSFLTLRPKSFKPMLICFKERY